MITTNSPLTNSILTYPLQRDLWIKAVYDTFSSRLIF